MGRVRAECQDPGLMHQDNDAFHCPKEYGRQKKCHFIHSYSHTQHVLVNFA